MEQTGMQTKLPSGHTYIHSHSLQSHFMYLYPAADYFGIQMSTGTHVQVSKYSIEISMSEECQQSPSCTNACMPLPLLIRLTPILFGAGVQVSWDMLHSRHR